MNKKKVLAFGEVMLRIAMNHHQMIEQTKDATLSFTGTGLNVLSGMTHFGHEGILVTQLPDNRLGEAAKAEIRKLGISDALIKVKGNHMGIYILEQGFGNRPSEVTYLDRVHSSFGLSKWALEEMEQMLQEVDIVHFCGISLMFTEETRKAVFTLAKQAKALGKRVCFDFNYRPSLAKEHSLEWIRQQYHDILLLADIVVGGYRDLTDLLALDQEIRQSSLAELAPYFIHKYQLTAFVGTHRTTEAQQKYLQGFIYTKEKCYTSNQYPIHIFDRIGTGDAYASGILTGYLENQDETKIVEFATASAVLSHTTLGDSPIVTKKQVEQFLENQEIEIIR